MVVKVAAEACRCRSCHAGSAVPASSAGARARSSDSPTPSARQASR